MQTSHPRTAVPWWLLVKKRLLRILFLYFKS